MRFCTSCGTELADGAKFCRQCGAVIEPLPQAREIDPFKTQFEPTERLDEKSAMDLLHKAKTEVIPPERDIRTVPMPPTVPTEAQPIKGTGSVPGAVRTTPLGNGRKWIALGVPAALLIVLSGAFFFFNYRNSSAEPTDGLAVASPTPEAPTPAPTASTTEQPVESPSPEAPNARPTGKPDSPQARSTPAPAQPAPTTAMPTPTPIPVQPIQRPANGAAPINPAYATPEIKSKPAATAADHWRTGVEFLNAGRAGEALREFEQARRLAPGNPDLFYLIGNAYQQMGRREEALAAYRQCTSGVYATVAQNHVRRLEGGGSGKEGKKSKKY